MSGLAVDHIELVPNSDTEYEDCCSSLNPEQPSPLHWSHITHNLQETLISAHETILSKLELHERVHEQHRSTFLNSSSSSSYCSRGNDDPKPFHSVPPNHAKEFEDDEHLQHLFFSAAPPFVNDTKRFAGFVHNSVISDDRNQLLRKEDTEEEDNLSPTTVLEAEISSSQSTPSAASATNFRDLTPFPASFPTVMTSMDALLAAESFEMSQAVPESLPERSLYELLEMKFDDFLCEHELPGRFQERDKKQPRGLQKLSNSLTTSFRFPGCRPPSFLPTAQHVRSKSLAGTNKQFMFGTFDATKNKSSNSSSSADNTNSDTSSEFSIDLNRRLSRVGSSSKKLDFAKDAEEQQQWRYSFRSDVKSNVEEIVPNKDESKFPFSPVSTAFRFAKYDTSVSDDYGYINFHPAASPVNHQKEITFVEEVIRIGSHHHKDLDDGKAKMGWCCFRS